MRRTVTTAGLLLAALMAVPALGAAQATRTVTGHVSLEAAGQSPSGVQVLVKGTNVGALTDREGDFVLVVPEGATTLVFTYIGFKTLEVPIQDRVEVTLVEEAIGLEGIVVTALGVQREKRSLGYAVQDVKGDEISAVPEVNLVNALQGNVAGVHITDAGVTGGSSRIVIRGESSFSGNNQPLFIVDGVPVDNSARSVSGYSGMDWGNSLQDFDASNIESISVLKGPNAAALYGSRAANGAVVITTKSAAREGVIGGLGITATSSITFEQPLKLPDYQNQYGQGVAGEFRWVDGWGGGTWDNTDESWGPKLDGRLIDQFTGPAQPWVAHPDNVRSFFNTGSTWNTNVSVTRAGESSNVRLSATNSQIEGMAPGNTIDRNSVALKGGAQVTDRFSTTASATYMSQQSDNRVAVGYDDDNPMQSFTWFGRQVDMDALRNYECKGTEKTPCVDGGQYNWNYNYHNNPFWEQQVNTNNDERDRLIGSLEGSYQINDWITVTGRVARDWYRWHRKNNTAMNSIDQNGGFGESTEYRTETNLDLLVAATRQLTDDLLLDAHFGGNQRSNQYEYGNVNVASLTVPGIYTIDNAAEAPIATDTQEGKKVRSLFGAVSLNYRGWLNLDLTGRNDWSSTLPSDQRSFFYPSVSTAFMFSDALGLEGDILSSGKLRMSWTRVGNDTDPYQLIAIMDAQTPYGSAPMFSKPNRLANANLKPEETTAWEVGTDLGFFNEALGFVLTYYDSKTRNQIMPVQISGATGFTSQILNAGELHNQGLELLLRATPIRMEDGFRWDVTLNWAKNTSEVTELYGDLQNLQIGTGMWSVNVEARLHEPYGTLFGNGYLRCGQVQIEAGDCTAGQSGMLMLDSRGRPRIDPERRVLGKYSPDWTGGIQNRFSYGPLDLSVLVDGQSGGDIFSVTNWFGTQSGVLARTLRGREVDWDKPGIVERGILPDGSVNGDGVDDVTVTSQDYFHYWWNNQEASIFDASYVKLREVRLGYRIPAEFMGRFGFSGGDFALIGRNLYLWTNTPNIDPETAYDASNRQGLESGQFPTARSFGFAVSIRP
jgi:TonB-linked SusC/RagA family outer membrane protein